MHTKRLSKAIVFVLTAMLIVSNVSFAFAEESSSVENPVVAGAVPNGVVMITSEDQLTPYFPDVHFRTAVFSAVKDGQDSAVGVDVVDALKNFLGDVPAKNKGITNIAGIDFLRKANKIDLTGNLITDFSHLGESVDHPDYQTWYGLTPKEYQVILDNGDDRDATTNVVWKLDKNPFEKIPANFGGRLVIEQAATASYTYPEDASTLYTYVRSTNEAISGDLNINKVKIIEGQTQTNAGIISVLWNAHGISDAVPFVVNWAKGNNDTAAFSDLKKSGSAHIAVGVDQVLHYVTSDEIGTLTPGSQSFKYYIPTAFNVYDRVSVSEDYKGSVVLTKVDKAQPATTLAGAEFALYKADNTLVKSGITTAENGTLSASGLAPGEYYFKETNAPAGYYLNNDTAPFTIAPSSGKATLSGGLQEVTPSGSSVPVKAGDNEAFVAGANKAGSSPDLTLDTDQLNVAKVAVTYSKLENADKTEVADVVREFDTAATAIADVNAEKNANRLLGPASIVVTEEGTPAQAVAVSFSNEAIPTAEIKGTKTWEDNEGWAGKVPDITLRLFNGTSEVTSMVLPGEIGQSNTTVEYTFGNLPIKDQDGNAITYTVKEDEVAGYSTQITGTFITNTWQGHELITLSGKKIWSDYSNALELRPEKIVLNLYDKTDMNTVVQTQEVVAGADSSWSYSFIGLDKYKDRHPVVYVIQEETTGLAHYEMPVISEDNASVTNTLKPAFNDIVSVGVEKKWIEADGIPARPASVVVDLLQNGNILQQITLTEANKWKAAVEGLPKFDEQGKVFAYTVQEQAVPGYTLTDQTWQAAADGNLLTGIFTNTKDPLPKPTPPDPSDSPESPAPNEPPALTALQKVNDPFAGGILLLGAVVVLSGLVAFGAHGRKGKKR